MNVEEIIKKLEKKENDLTELRERWNRRAPTYPDKADKKQEIVFDFIEENITVKNKSILDVGCGSGRYISIALARGAKIVTGVEIADKMLEIAQNNLELAGYKDSQYELVRSAWESINLSERNWRKHFDIVIAFKTPALNSANNIKKMLIAAKEAFFFSNHLMRSEPLYEELYREVHGIEKAFGNEREKVLLDLLRAWGYKPKTHVYDFAETRQEAIGDLLLRYGDWIFNHYPNKKEIAWLKEALNERSADGEYVEHQVNTKEALSFVKL